MWHFNIRVSKRLVEAYDLGQIFPNYNNGFIRGTMRTKCSDEAERNIRAVLAKLDELRQKLDSISSRIQSFENLSETERDKLSDDLGVNIAKLPHDQKQLLNGDGGVWNAGHKWRHFKNKAAFLEAGAGSEYELKEMLGEEFDPEDREGNEAQELFDVGLAQKKADKYEKALTAAGIIEPTTGAKMGLRALMEKFCAAKGYLHGQYRNQTRGQYEYAVRRFIEFHGDLPIAELTRKSLSVFAADFLKLPISSRKDVRPLAFRDAVRVADREGLPRVSVRTRDQNLLLLKALMAYAVHEEDREAPDPWAGYLPTVVKQKVSEKRKNKSHSFTRNEVKLIVAETFKTREPNTIDYWGPIFGAYYGLRVEEICQIRIADVTREEGFLCVAVTDEAEGQKVKNENSYRTIPIHTDLIEMGFEDFVELRRKAGGDFLFMVAERWGGKLREISPCGRGRYGTFFLSRFSSVCEKLEIDGKRVGTHSFRRAWTDLARNAGINPEHRRALSGRDSDAGSISVDGIEDLYGHGFSIKVLSESLNNLKPLG